MALTRQINPNAPSQPLPLSLVAPPFHLHQTLFGTAAEKASENTPRPQNPRVRQEPFAPHSGKKEMKTEMPKRGKDKKGRKRRKGMKAQWKPHQNISEQGERRERSWTMSNALNCLSTPLPWVEPSGPKRKLLQLRVHAPGDRSRLILWSVSSDVMTSSIFQDRVFKTWVHLCHWNSVHLSSKIYSEISGHPKFHSGALC